MIDINERFSEKKNFLNRLIFVYIFFACLFLYLIYKTFSLQVSSFTDYEIASLKKENEKYANSVVPSYLGTIDLLKEDIERLEKDNKTFKKRYETQIEENVSIFEEPVALKKEIEELKNSSPPAGHTNYSWREILGRKPKN